jgi:hypothetical protein
VTPITQAQTWSLRLSRNMSTTDSTQLYISTYSAILHVYGGYPCSRSAKDGGGARATSTPGGVSAHAAPLCSLVPFPKL